MIPYGMNPFGLEPLRVFFHHEIHEAEGDDSMVVTVTTWESGWLPLKTVYHFGWDLNLKYSYASFPKNIRDNYGLDWAIEPAANRAQWKLRTKYYSKKVEELYPFLTIVVRESGKETDTIYRFQDYTGANSEAAVTAFLRNEKPDLSFTYKSHQLTYFEPYWGDTMDPARPMHMMMADQVFYRYVWIDWDTPEYASVYILDTSGSMDVGDYDSVKRAMTGGIHTYAKQYDSIPGATPNSKLWLYDGTYLENITSQKCMGSVALDEMTVNELHGEVSRLINNANKHGTSEAMITCLYYAIGEIQKKLLKKQEIGATRLKGLNFVLCTDESVFTSDTLWGYDTWLNHTIGSGWFASWQDNGSNTNKFPTTYTDSALVSKITEALKQMSHYYGVNITWSLTREITQDWAKRSVLPFLNTVRVQSGGNGGNGSLEYMRYESGHTQKYQNNWNSEDATHPCWIVPSDFHVDSPHCPMCKIELKLPDGFTIKDAKKMGYDDQYNTTNITSKFHKVDDTTWCAFRYFPRTSGAGGESIVLPGSDDITVPDGVNVNGYKWVNIDIAEANKQQIGLGDTYTVSKTQAVDELITDPVTGTVTTVHGNTVRFELTQIKSTIIFHLNNSTADSYPAITTSNCRWDDSETGTKTISLATGDNFPELVGATCDVASFTKWMISNGTAAGTGSIAGAEAGSVAGYYYFPEGYQLSSYQFLEEPGEYHFWAQWEISTVEAIPEGAPAGPGEASGVSEWEIVDEGNGKSHTTGMGDTAHGYDFTSVLNSISVPDGKEYFTMQNLHKQCNCQSRSTDPCYYWVKLARYPLDLSGNRIAANVTYYIIPKISIYRLTAPWYIAIHTIIYANISNPLWGEVTQVGFEGFANDYENFKLDVTPNVGITITTSNTGYGARYGAQNVTILQTKPVGQFNSIPGTSSYSGQQYIDIYKTSPGSRSSGYWGVFTKTGEIHQYYNRTSRTNVLDGQSPLPGYASVRDSAYNYPWYTTYFPLYKLNGAGSANAWGDGTVTPMKYFYTDNGKFHGEVY